MAEYTGAFELRRLVIVFTRVPTGGTQEDAAMITIRFAKLTAGAPDAGWVAGDYTAVEAAADTWWGSMKGSYPTWLTLARYDWYKSGPAWEPSDRADGPPNPRERTTARAVAGTSAFACLPPSTAVTVTFVTDTRKRWGRLFLPAPCVDSADSNGRVLNTRVTGTFSTAMVTFLNTCRAASKQPVVFSRGRSAYVTGRGASIPAHAATAYEILSVQVDNQFDVMRSRRWDVPTVRQLTALT